MKTLKATLALGLAAALFAGCSKNANNTNSTTTTTTTTNNASSKVSAPAATPAATVTSTPTTAGNNTDNSSSSGAGELFTHREAGVQFNLPAGWKTKNEGETLVATSEHEAISVVLWVPRGDDFDKATDELKQQLQSVIKNPQVTTPGQETTHNGMRAYTAAGTGEVNGENILWEVDVLQARKPFFVVTFAAPQMFQMHKSDYQQLLGSLKPVQ